MTPTEIAYSFIEAINSGDPDQLAKLMTENHKFIDSDGSVHAGRDVMRREWKDYSSMVPDFRIHVEDLLTRDNTVALFGIAEGTFSQDGDLNSENHWAVQVAWRVVVQGEKVAVWQLYVNPDRMLEILNRIDAS